jgi:hypothetical protein
MGVEALHHARCVVPIPAIVEQAKENTRRGVQVAYRRNVAPDTLDDLVGTNVDQHQPLNINKHRKESMSKYLKIKEMSCDAIESVTRRMTWSEGYGETWDCWEAVTCDACGGVVVLSMGGDDMHKNCGIGDTECEGHLGLAEGPMMNFFYPLPASFERKDVEEAAKRIVNLPLCIVKLSPPDGDDEWGLALTGGGMDLSWEICEAFMRLGYKPPLHFVPPPEMSGRGESNRDRWILSGCRSSARIARDWASAKLMKCTELARRVKKSKAARPSVSAK